MCPVGTTPNTFGPIPQRNRLHRKVVAMPDRFAGQSIIVTGASRGIGAATARRLAAEGADLTLVARTLDAHPTLPGSLNETADACRSHGANVHVLVADLGSEESRAAIVPAAMEAMGKVDVLINNAAAAIYASLLDYPLRRRRLMMEINVHAPIDLAQAVIPHMVERGSGWIVNIGSGSANFNEGPPFRSEGVANEIGVYGASKSALNRITNALGSELHGTGIRVNTLEPLSAVMSEGADVLVGGMLRDDQIESMEAMVEAILFVCDCEADYTGRLNRSLEVLDDNNITVMNLDGETPYPGGQRVWRGDS